MGFFEKLKEGLAKTKNAFVSQVDNLFKSFVKVDEELFDELEELLICADVGVGATEEILDKLRDRVKSERLTDGEQVKAALHNAVSLVPGILPEPAPFVRVAGYGESNIDYVVRVWCKTADYWTVYYDLMEAVGAAFDAHGVSMSYPQMNVHVLDTPESAKKD